MALIATLPLARGGVDMNERRRARLTKAKDRPSFDQRALQPDEGQFCFATEYYSTMTQQEAEAARALMSAFLIGATHASRFMSHRTKLLSNCQ